MFTSFPVTGNLPAAVYIIIAAVAGVLVIGSLLAGIFTKKKK